MKPLLITSGEPAGIGPDLCLALADSPCAAVVLGDIEVLKARAAHLKKDIRFLTYSAETFYPPKAGELWVLPLSCPQPVIPGQLNPDNAHYVLDMLGIAAQLCQQGEFQALITAPVHKANINAAGIPFSGHTEFLADFFAIETVVMLLVGETLRVALATTHLPLAEVPKAITAPLLCAIIRQLEKSLREDFALAQPLIKVAGLNPHAGESGYLGQEEIQVITPVLRQLNAEGIQVEGPYPADTLFVQKADCFVAMYHDQGLPVLKYASFHEAVNVTLGLPIIRTSVDHGTALELAGSGKASADSLLSALSLAQHMAENRYKNAHN